MPVMNPYLQAQKYNVCHHFAIPSNSKIVSQSSKSDGENGIAGGNWGTGVVGSVGAMCGNSAKGSGSTCCSRETGDESDVLMERVGLTGEVGERGQESGRGPDGLRRSGRHLSLCVDL
jgi:hypothetical protein